MRLAVALALIVVGVAPPAVAGELAGPAGHQQPQPWQRWVDLQPLWIPDTVGFVHGDCPDDADAYGCAGAGTVWVAVSLRYRALARHVLYHELGHIVDSEMTDSHRARIMGLVGWRSWRAEAFADRWAMCANPRVQADWMVRRLRPLCRLLRHRPPLTTGRLAVPQEALLEPAFRR